MREFAQIAGLMADPSRARMLDELMSGQPLPAGVLASRAGIARSTASEHLAKLSDAGLVTITRSGRVREVRIAGPAVAEAIEALGQLAPQASGSGLRTISRMDALRHARSCYDHLAGQLGVALTKALIEHGALAPDDGTFAVCPSSAWTTVGVDVEHVRASASRRPLARPCPDWTERQPHVAGRIGAELLQSLLTQQWVQRRPTDRALRITDAGLRSLTPLVDLSAATAPTG